jgi:hypothetical protein
MSSHSESLRLANSLASMFQTLSPTQQQVMAAMLSQNGQPADTSGFAELPDLDHQIEEAREHFFSQVRATPSSST